MEMSVQVASNHKKAELLEVLFANNKHTHLHPERGGGYTVSLCFLWQPRTWIGSGFHDLTPTSQLIQRKK